MPVKNSVKAIPLTSIDSATVSSSYQAINAGGLPHPCFLIRIANNSTQPVTISYDGSTDNEFVLDNYTLEVPFAVAAQPGATPPVFQKGWTVYVKGTAGTGNIYLSGYYQPQGE